MADHKVLQYEFLLSDNEEERFVVRAYLAYHVLRCLPWRTQLSLLRHYSNAWFEDMLPPRASEWVWDKVADKLSQAELRLIMLQYLKLYVQQPDRVALPLGFENRSRQFLVASQEERTKLSRLMAEDTPWRLYVFAPNYIMAPTQIFLSSIG